jgi:histone H3/H4
LIREAVEEEAAGEFFTHALIEKLALFVEMETRHMLETSCKFMTKDRRDVLEQEDVVLAVREHGYVDLVVDELNSRGKDPYLSM